MCNFLGEMKRCADNVENACKYSPANAAVSPESDGLQQMAEFVPRCPIPFFSSLVPEARHAWMSSICMVCAQSCPVRVRA